MAVIFSSKEFKKSLHSIATELFFVFFRRKKNKYNGTIYLFSFTKEMRYYIITELTVNWAALLSAKYR